MGLQNRRRRLKLAVDAEGLQHCCLLDQELQGPNIAATVGQLVKAMISLRLEQADIGLDARQLRLRTVASRLIPPLHLPPLPLVD